MHQLTGGSQRGGGDLDGDGFPAGFDCDDSNPAVNPAAAEICGNFIDENCDGSLTAGCGSGGDFDGDGYSSPVDCDDFNASIHPGAVEICTNNIDENCDGSLTVGCGSTIDNDGDGYNNITDCNDNNPLVHPGATEICGNASDENCDGSTTIGCGGTTDADGDGFSVNVDCNDNNASINPAATEICNNQVDENCDGSLTAGCGGMDADGDGHFTPADCNDNNSIIHPAALEICGNQVDENCDGSLTIGCTGTDNDGDGYSNTNDCNDNNSNIHPGATEVCSNGIDENCDGSQTSGCVNANSCTKRFHCYSESFWFDPLDAYDGDMWALDEDLKAPNATISNTFTGNWMLLEENTSSGYNDYLAVTSWFQVAGTANDWLIFGPVTVQSSVLKISWFHAYNDNNYRDGYALKMSTTSNQPSAFTTTLWKVKDNSTHTAGDTVWTLQTVIYNASALVGDRIYFAIHHNATDQFILNLDDITVSDCSNVITVDNDGDGYIEQADCNDNNASISPGATEVCGNSVDENCDGSLTIGCADADSDGFIDGNDCNDNNPAINPNASEICSNATDENCDGSLTIGCYTGVSVKEQDHQFTVVPNPSNDEFTFRYRYSDNAQLVIAIYAPDGRNVHHVEVHAASTGRVSVHLSDLPAGVYYARMTYGSATHVQKIILIK